jgi:DNA primase
MITHAEKVMFPDCGITKGELAEYYARVAPIMVPHLAGRPVTLERFHKGIGEKGFFQKNVAKGAPEWLERVAVPKTVAQELLRFYTTTPERPRGFAFDEPFALPAGVRAIAVARGTATVTQ